MLRPTAWSQMRHRLSWPCPVKLQPDQHSIHQISQVGELLIYKEYYKQMNVFFYSISNFSLNSFLIDRNCFTLVVLRSCNSSERRPLQRLFYQLYWSVKQKYQKEQKQNSESARLNDFNYFLITFEYLFTFVFKSSL